MNILANRKLVIVNCISGKWEVWPPQTVPNFSGPGSNQRTGPANLWWSQEGRFRQLMKILWIWTLLSSFGVCFLVFIQIQSATLCCVWWSGHWSANPRAGERLPPAGGHARETGGHDGKGKDWAGLLQVRHGSRSSYIGQLSDLSSAYFMFSLTTATWSWMKQIVCWTWALNPR